MVNYYRFFKRHISDNLCLFRIGVSKFVCKLVSTLFYSSSMTNLLQGGAPTLLVAIRLAKVLDKRVEGIWIEEESKNT